MPERDPGTACPSIRYRAQGLNLIGVTVDAEGMESQIADFVKEFQMDYTLWHDPAGRYRHSSRLSGTMAANSSMDVARLPVEERYRTSGSRDTSRDGHPAGAREMASVTRSPSRRED